MTCGLNPRDARTRHKPFAQTLEADDQNTACLLLNSKAIQLRLIPNRNVGFTKRAVWY